VQTKGTLVSQTGNLINYHSAVLLFGFGLRPGSRGVFIKVIAVCIQKGITKFDEYCTLPFIKWPA
jgi:hypothetical protein